MKSKLLQEPGTPGVGVLVDPARNAFGRKSKPGPKTDPKTDLKTEAQPGAGNDEEPGLSRQGSICIDFDSMIYNLSIS